MAVAVNDMKAVSLLTAFFIDCFVGPEAKCAAGIGPDGAFCFFWGNKKKSTLGERSTYE